MIRNKVYCGNALDVLSTFPDESCDCCITSPPYYALRDYQTAMWMDGDPKCEHRLFTCRMNEYPRNLCEKCGAKQVDFQLGQETTPEQYIENLVAVFEQVKRVLKPHGTLWIVIGDTYASTAQGTVNSEDVFLNSKKTGKARAAYRPKLANIKPKDLIGIPWMLAFALRGNGWYLRQDIIWAKTSGMPESVTDRCTRAHEYIFLLSKEPYYYYDAHAIKTLVKSSSVQRAGNAVNEDHRYVNGAPGSRPHTMNRPRDAKQAIEKAVQRGKIEDESITSVEHVAGDLANKRDVWLENDDKSIWHWFFEYSTDEDRQIWQRIYEEYVESKQNAGNVWWVSLSPFRGAHFATFPPALITPMIKAATSFKGNCKKCGFPYERVIEKRNKEIVTVGWRKSCGCETNDIERPLVLDPFMGAGTTAVEALAGGRDFIGVELNASNIEMTDKRLHAIYGAEHMPVFIETKN